MKVKVGLTVAALALAATSAWACSTIVVGKAASVTGRVMVGHNEDDDGVLFLHHGIVPARTHAAGTALPAELGCAAVPQVAETCAFYWSEVKDPAGGLPNADAFLNRNGVFLVSNNGCCEPPEDEASALTDGGVRWNLRRAVAERAASARQAVDVITNLVTAWGYAMPGRMYTVADRDEAWTVEIVKGRRFVARRCPDDQVVVIPNCYTIHALEPGDIVSPDIAAKAKADPSFDFARAYQGGPSCWKRTTDVLRFKHMYRIAAGRDFDKNDCPFSAKPARPVAAVDLQLALSTHYEGTPDEVKPKHGTAGDSAGLPVCRASTVESTVCVFRETVEADELRVARGAPCEKAYVPFRPFGEGVPAAFDESVDAVARLESHVKPLPGWRAHKGGWTAIRLRPLDFSKRVLSEGELDRIRTVAECEGPDGIELDWTGVRCLVQGRERVDAPYLTDFMRTVRRQLDTIGDRLGRRIGLRCRVPSDPKTARALGLMTDEWEKIHSVDALVPDARGNLLPAAEPKDVPELMKTADGRIVSDLATWEKTRRREIRELFEREIYGRRPAERPARLSFTKAEPDRTMLEGKAVRKRIRITYGDRCGESSFDATAFVPASATPGKPVPAFLLICNRNPQENLDPERNVKSGFWPVEQIVARGYAAIAFFNGDVAKDYCWDFSNGVFGVFQKPEERTEESWGILSAWAWGASRVMDWIETEPTLDARHVAVVGHSRGGKTALLAGVTDERFAMACVNCSGCGGAKLNHMDLPLSEHYDQIWKAIGCWFCGNFEKYLYREHQISFDAHWWMSLMAPRLLAVASASEDSWAGQEGEFQAARLASPAWGLYGRKGLVGDTFPGAENPLQSGDVSYHMRTGEHNLTPYDWDRYMDFADRHGWKAKP